MKSNRIIALIILTLALAVTCSCTVIGFGVGMLADEHKAKEKNLFPGEISGLKPGTEMLISPYSDSTVAGIFLKVAPMSDSLFYAGLEAFRKRSDEWANLPEPGDTLTLVTPGGIRSHRIFVGYADSSLTFHEVGDSARVEVLPRHIAKTVSISGDEVESDTYMRALGLLTRPEMVVVVSLGHEREIPLWEIRQVIVPNTTDFVVKGVCIGLGLDVFAAVLYYTVLFFALRNFE